MQPVQAFTEQAHAFSCSRMGYSIHLAYARNAADSARYKNKVKVVKHTALQLLQLVVLEVVK